MSDESLGEKAAELLLLVFVGCLCFVMIAGTIWIVHRIIESW